MYNFRIVLFCAFCLCPCRIFCKACCRALIRRVPVVHTPSILPKLHNVPNRYWGVCFRKNWIAFCKMDLAAPNFHQIIFSNLPYTIFMILLSSTAFTIPAKKYLTSHSRLPLYTAILFFFCSTLTSKKFFGIIIIERSIIWKIIK